MINRIEPFHPLKKAQDDIFKAAVVITVVINLLVECLEMFMVDTNDISTYSIVDFFFSEGAENATGLFKTFSSWGSILLPYSSF